MEVFDLALNYLTFKTRTEKEIRDYLKKKKIRSDLIEETIGKLKEYNYINDQNYVKMYLDYNDSSQMYGKIRVANTLKKRGISDQDIEMINDYITPEKEEIYSKFHFSKVEKLTKELPYIKRVNKIIRYLSSRGFNYETFSQLITKIPKTIESFNEEKFEKDLEHYLKLYTRKGFSNRDLKNKVIKGLLSKGYHYDLIAERFTEIDFNND